MFVSMVTWIRSSKREQTVVWPREHHVLGLLQSALQPLATPPRPPCCRHSKPTPPAGERSLLHFLVHECGNPTLFSILTFLKSFKNNMIQSNLKQTTTHVHHCVHEEDYTIANSKSFGAKKKCTFNPAQPHILLMTSCNVNSNKYILSR